MQAKALESRTNAWDKRVANARKARLQQEAELENKFETPPLPPPSSTAPANASSGPEPRVLSAEEMKAYEVQRAQAQMGFNPYNAVFSSSTEASSVMNAVSAPALPPPAPVRTQSAGYAPSQPHASLQAGELPPLSSEATTEGGGVYVLLRQDPRQAIAAAQTIIKMLGNVLQSPEVCVRLYVSWSLCPLVRGTTYSDGQTPSQEEKFRKIRLANASIQSKLVAVSGAVDLLQEAGFVPVTMDGEQFLVLAVDTLDRARVQAVLDRTEVASIQLQVDSADLSA